MNFITLRSHRNFFIFIGLLVFFSFCASLLIGRYPLSLPEVVAIIFGGEVSDTSQAVFLRLRLPRTIVALLAGLALGFVGAVFQLVFRNPLAAPDIIGVTSGANLGAAFAVVTFGHNMGLLTASAFIGSIAAVFFVVAVAKLTRGGSTLAFILAGIVIRAISDAFIMILRYYADPERELAAIDYWSMGSLGTITASRLSAMLPFFFVGLIALILLRRHIFLLGLEDDESRTLGVNTRHIRVIILSFSALVVASVIAVTGPIAFVGLIAPHVARLAIKRVSFAWCALSALIGAFIILLADTAIRGLSPFEIPISIPTTLIGVPILLYFMWRRKVGRV